ncbi:unnamed protein product [Pylaiella littoralis]
MAREAAAKEAVDAAVTDEQKSAAKEKLNVATRKRNLTEKARDDQSTGARTSTVRGQKVTVTEAAWEGRAAPTPLEREAMHQSSADSSRRGGMGDKTLYGRDKGDDARSLSSEQGASMRPTDTSAKWKDHAVEEPNNAEPASCSNCGAPTELLWFFYRGGKRRVVVSDHMRGKHRCKKNSKKPRGVFKPTNREVKTITKDGLLKAARREAR